MKEGREKLFDKFLSITGLDKNLLPICLSILRNFRPERQIPIFQETRDILRALKSLGKVIFILTNGNPEQQKNKIRSLDWEGLDEEITFILADEIEPKPSPAGVFHILERSGISADKSLFIGDSITDRICAERGGIQFIDIKELHSLN
jgi:HAD superfamily hydrolase (TIGR01549 family)